MRISMKWMNELVDVSDVAIPELVDHLDMTGTAVEAVDTLGESLEGVVVGHILTKERHPDADKLWVTTVDVGEDEPKTIVCGAQNFEAGDRVPVALVGATLPNGMTIKKAKLRGVKSEGMNCSAAELGMGSDHSGLLILEQDAPVGVGFAEYRGLSDTVLELEITPNRPDCLSVHGMAREIGAIYDRPVTLPQTVVDQRGPSIADAASVSIEDPELCSRYTARVIRNVKIGPSPEWLVERVIACGARPVNNVVDITNYVMFETGQPLHAFDVHAIAKDESGRPKIIVRRAAEGERLTTLDGQDRALDAEILLISDPSGPIALAGVMGGQSTEVSEATVDILLESAMFDASTTSLTSRSLGLISEASMRFERGVDPNGNVAASDRAAQLMADLCGGIVDTGVIDEYPVKAEPAVLQLRLDYLNRILGATLTVEQASDILTALGMDVTTSSADAVSKSGSDATLAVTVPTFRPDVSREIDLVEEVLRVWGMEQVEATLPGGRTRAGSLDRSQRWRERIGATLRACGLNETMTYAFVDPADSERLGWELDEGERLVEILNPMSEEQAVMRRTLAAGLLRAVSYNQRRGVSDVHLYELGRVFFTSEGRKLPKEREMVAGVLTGRWSAPAWNDPRGADADSDETGLELGFFDGKGAIQALMADLGIENWTIRPVELPWLQPGRSAEIMLRGQRAGWIGEVHPIVLARFEASPPVALFELDVNQLTKAAVDVKSYTDVPRFPAIELDVALVVDDSVTDEDIRRVMKKSGGKLLDSIGLFDIYRGQGVPDGKKSMAYALTYRSEDRTLADEDVRPTHDKLIDKVSNALGAQLRA